MTVKGVQVFDGDGDQPVQIYDLERQITRRRYVEGHYPAEVMNAVLAGMKNAPADTIAAVILNLTKVEAPTQKGTPAEQEKRRLLMSIPAWRRYPGRVLLFGGIFMGLCTISAAIMIFNERPASVLWALGAWSVAMSIIGAIWWCASTESA